MLVSRNIYVIHVIIIYKKIFIKYKYILQTYMLNKILRKHILGIYV